jgi:hypothetical protein
MSKKVKQESSQLYQEKPLKSRLFIVQKVSIILYGMSLTFEIIITIFYWSLIYEGRDKL